MSKADKMFEELGYRKMVPSYWVAEYYNDSNDSVIQFNANTQEVRLGHTDYDISIFNKEILLAIHEKMKELDWISAGNDSCGTEWDLLQELVDKETPMKPINTYKIDFGPDDCGNCSKCESLVNYLMTYCYKCGHRIDWSKNV